MRKLPFVVLAFTLLLGSATSSASVSDPVRGQAEQNDGSSKSKLSDAQIRQILIDESIASYSGNCPCPYNRDRRGRSCGRRSAYSREGGEAPLCYAKDVSREMVEAYREANASP